MKGERDAVARAQVLSELRRGVSVQEAARVAGVSRFAIYKWADRGDEEMKAALPGGGGGRRRRSAIEPARPVPAAPPARPVDQAAQAAPAGAVPPDPPKQTEELTAEQLNKMRQGALGTLVLIAQKGTAETARVAAAKALLDYTERNKSVQSIPPQAEQPNERPSFRVLDPASPDAQDEVGRRLAL